MVRWLVPLLAALFALGTLPERAAADGPVVVLRPEVGARVGSGPASRAWASMKRVAARRPEARFEDLSPSSLAPGRGLACVADAACLARTGRAVGAARVVGSLLLAGEGGLTATLVVVDTASGAIVGMTQGAIPRAGQGPELGALLERLLASLRS